MKYLFLSPVVWRFYKLQNQSLAASLARKGNDVVYVEPLKYKGWKYNSRFMNASENEEPNTLSLIQREKKWRKSFFLFLYENWNNVKHIRTQKPSIVVCYDHLMGLFPCVYCKITKIPFIFNVSDDWDNIPQYRLQAFVWKYFIKPVVASLSFGIASISHKQYEIYSLKNRNTFLLPNGIEYNESDFDETPDNSESSAEVNFVGHLRDWYNFDLLFEVFADIPDLILNIYGTGPLFGPLKEKSKQYPNINLKGNLNIKDAPAVYKRSLLGVIPLFPTAYNQSTAPVKLFDYWAAGKAVIATPAHELKSIAADCVLFASTKDEWITHIHFLKDNPSRRTYLGHTGQEKVQDKYNYDSITQQFTNFTEKNRC